MIFMLRVGLCVLGYGRSPERLHTLHHNGKGGSHWKKAKAAGEAPQGKSPCSSSVIPQQELS